ncbi:MAG: pyridoxamine 5'-phosphate oxidase family protein [Ferruginibacter sp.]
MQYNYQDENLAFLKEKIREIKIALFKSEINSELQLPNNIIQVLKIEDDGTIWFFTSCSGKQAESIERSFYAYLDFYKKGTDCRLQISGRASIADNDEGLFDMSNYSKGISGSLILVKMKIMQAEYFESSQLGNVSLTERIKSVINHLFVTPQHRVYDFS